MNDSYSILHISDLHRSLHDPISNDELLSSLILDRERYIKESPKIPIPEAIIVSGDFIQGVSLGSANYQASLKNQYNTALEFLNELTNRFLDGDKSKVVIVPGNHDIDWNTAFSAMKRLEKSEIPKDFSQQLLNEHSLFRWDWKEQVAYKIVDTELYEKRLDEYWNFFEQFYAGVSGLLSVKPKSDANLYKLFDGKIAIAAYNSCYGNDCFAFHGMIRKEVIARSYLELKDIGSFDLLMAVWHHNIEGPPYRSDYMDIDVVKSMIGRNFRLGVYGHQHKAQVAPYQVWLPDQERMAVVSAGSLCAGRYDLPTGVPRQYNILEISKDLKSVRVHVREMRISNLFSPGRFHELGGNSYTDLNWENSKNVLGKNVNVEGAKIRELTESAEFLLMNGSPKETIKILLKLNLSQEGYQRQLFLKAAQSASDWPSILSVIDPPLNIFELILKVESFNNIHNYSEAKKMLDTFGDKLGLPKATEDELRKRIEIQIQITNHG
ncbi:metallophosphoesterase family protein [Mucilaginibacter polytrichastri]|uniref:Calcineurin-like phosphoesterase domain-containing protein n=1 Tax=Mucilaginibacter polytrichastri TaxID=1302689 RepID=A0A1Q6A5E7_9SPHI|nr:metallophosphoesterase [Mucilaginibacter polytrichastri]OKS89235.1 hypothetical protein RG47T_4718 [Mucilaginibacter polytrichastri]SFS98414.1 Calcineurin-like phosphoesterase [Mucilaginibacter polytrichastri]